MSRNSLVSMIERLSEHQVDQVSKMTEDFLCRNEDLSDTMPKFCPVVDSIRTMLPTVNAVRPIRLLRNERLLAD